MGPAPRILQTDHKRKSTDELRVAVVGGSTVECSMLAADKRWSAVLEANLHTKLDRAVTVVNLRTSSQDTRTHLATTSHIVTHAITPANFIILLATINDTLLSTCKQHGYACVDMDSKVPKGFASFYDQVHFNEAGAQHVAEALIEPVRSLLR